MADSQYATAIGFVQFDVTEREANGQTVRDATLRTPGTEGSLIRVTLWPDFDEANVQKGDFIAVDGKIEVREVDGKTYINMNANKLHHKGQDYATAEREREVVGRKSARKAF